jgi:hypothetical protein
LLCDAWADDPPAQRLKKAQLGVKPRKKQATTSEDISAMLQVGMAKVKKRGG